MDPKRKEARETLRGIVKRSEFNDLLNSVMLSDDEKTILYLHYLNGKDFAYIADQLGYAEITVKLKHKHALNKISKLI